MGKVIRPASEPKTRLLLPVKVYRLAMKHTACINSCISPCTSATRECRSSMST
jgi:hypothetical protein